MTGPEEGARPDTDILVVFRREAEEQAAQAEAALLDLERDSGDRGALKALFRALHSLKGNAACVGQDAIEAAVHQLETVLHPIREGQRVLERSLADALFPLVYALRDAALLGAEPPARGRIDALAGLVEQAPVPAAATTNVFRIVLQYPGEAVPAGLDPRYVLEDVADLGEVLAVTLDEASVLPLSRLDHPDALSLRYVVDVATTRSIDEIREACILFEQAVRVTVEPIQEVGGGAGAPGAEAGRGSALRIDASRLDRLTNLASEVALSGGRLRRLVTLGAETAEILEAIDHLESRCRAMQEESLGARMISIDELLRPFVRLVRELSAALGKQVELTIEGRDVELDKALVEHMREPLTHLVRNALDHGIETPKARVAAGKPAAGRLTIAASQREGSIFLVVRDDGRGLDRKRIREKAVARGLVAPDRRLTDEETDQLIFESGLSTAAQVTNVSGRGVGMDIVRRSIEQVRGEVRVASVPGRGCAFEVRLPLTLAVIDGFLAAVGGDTVVIPVHAVSEVIDLPAASRRHERIGVLNLGGTPLPFLRLRERFGLPPPPGGREHVVVVRHETRRIGLVVDALLGQSQTVVKPLGRLFGDVSSVAGATVLWNGRVALILDVPGLFREIAGETAAQVA